MFSDTLRKSNIRIRGSFKSFSSVWSITPNWFFFSIRIAILSSNPIQPLVQVPLDDNKIRNSSRRSMTVKKLQLFVLRTTSRNFF